MVHTFTEEEASIARHIGPRARETAESVAACSKLKAIEMGVVPGVADFKQDRTRGVL